MTSTPISPSVTERSGGERAPTPIGTTTRGVSAAACAALEWMIWCGHEPAGSFRRVNVTSHDDLIASAEAVLNPHAVDGRWLGDVASTLVTAAGAVFSGVCIDTGSGTGFCAEHAAIAAMVTAGEYKITKIVAVPRHQRHVKGA